MQNIKGKVVAITGASSGMGKAIVIELAKKRCTGDEAIFAQIDVKNKPI